MEEINFNQNNLENISEKIADELMNGNYKIVDTLKNTDLRLFISFFLDNYPNLIAIKLLFALHKNITKFKKTDWLVVVNGFVDLNFNGHFNLIYFLICYTDARKPFFQQINLELDCCDNRGGFEHFYKNIKSLEIINTPITKGLIEKLQIKTKDLHSIKNIGVE